LEDVLGARARHDHDPLLVCHYDIARIDHDYAAPDLNVHASLAHALGGNRRGAAGEHREPVLPRLHHSRMTSSTTRAATPRS
jgi:hypothetical protein